MDNNINSGAALPLPMKNYAANLIGQSKVLQKHILNLVQVHPNITTGSVAESIKINVEELLIQTAAANTHSQLAANIHELRGVPDFSYMVIIELREFYNNYLRIWRLWYNQIPTDAFNNIQAPLCLDVFHLPWNNLVK